MTQPGQVSDIDPEIVEKMVAARKKVKAEMGNLKVPGSYFESWSEMLKAEAKLDEEKDKAIKKRLKIISFESSWTDKQTDNV